MKKSNYDIITDEYQLEFAIFCIENIAIRLKKTSDIVYAALVKKSNILNEYIIPNYEVLHTQDKEYIIDDVLTVLREEGVEI